MVFENLYFSQYHVSFFLNVFEGNPPSSLVFGLTIKAFDRVPAFLNEPVDKVDKLRADIVTYNNRVRSLLAQFKAAYDDVEGQIFETAPTFQKAYANPQAYGAPDATCVNGDGVSCLWYDTYHPGIAIQKSLAEEIVKFTGFF